MCFGSSDRSQDRWDSAPRPAKGYGGYSDRPSSSSTSSYRKQEKKKKKRHCGMSENEVATFVTIT
jgi:hypothetical protein